MGPQTKAEAYQRIQVETLSAWRNVHLFDSKYSETTDGLFATEAESRRKGFFDDWRPGNNQPLFSFHEWRTTFRPDNRLFWAIDYWHKFPDYLRRNVDQWAERFPDLAEDYGNRHGGLERMYHFAHEKVTQYLIDVAEANEIPGAGDISIAGELCRELVGDRAARRNLWGSEFVIRDWPECFLQLQQGTSDERMALRKGNAVIALLESLLTRWRKEPAIPIPPKPVWDKETRTLTFDGEVIRTVRNNAKWTPILDVFQDDGWPPKVDIPLAPGVNVSDCLKALNKDLKSIKFTRDGDTIRWKYCREQELK